MIERRRPWLALALFAGLAVWQTWPIAAAPERLYVDHPDVFSNVWSLNEMARRIVRDPLRLFDGNIFHPYPNTLAVVDHHLSNMVLAVPLRAIDPDPLFVYNLVLLLTFVLSGFFTYLFVAQVSGSSTAGIVAGCVFAFSNYRFTHLIHLHLLHTEWLPLALLALHRFHDAPTWRRLGVLTLAGGLLAFASWHMAMIGGLAVAIVGIAILIGSPEGRMRRVVMLAVAAAVIVAALLPLAHVYRQVAGWRPPMTEAAQTRDLSRHAVPLEGLVTPGLLARHRYMPVLVPDLFGESRLFPGAAPVALAAVALFAFVPRRQSARRAARLIVAGLAGTVFVLALAATIAAANGWTRPLDLLRPVAPFVLAGIVVVVAALRRIRTAAAASGAERTVAIYGLLAVVGLVMALGPRVYGWSHDLGTGIFQDEMLPALFRAPARFSLLMIMGLAVLAGFGARWLVDRAGRRGAASVATMAVVAVIVDLQAVMPVFKRAPSRQAVHRWLAELPEPGAVTEYPTNSPWPVYGSLFYDRRIVNGGGAVWPPEMERFADRDAFTRPHLEVLWEYFHPRFLVLRSGLYSREQRGELLARVAAQGDALRLRAEFGQDYVYELMDRGSGPALIRSWPRKTLDGRRGLAFEGAVARTREGTIPRLSVGFNGHVGLEVEGEQSVFPQRRFVPLHDEWMVPGSNAFEIWGEYRYASGDAANDIGRTGATVAADIEVHSGGDRGFVRVNGRDFRLDRGYRLVVLDPRAGRVQASREFNTSWYADEAAALARFVAQTPPGAVVAIATELDASRQLTDEAVTALRSLGLAGDLRGRFRWAHAAIGVKGAPPGTALEQMDPAEAQVTLGKPERPVVQLAWLDLY